MILSPLCSALVIPGLGQIINGNLKKGLILLTMVFLLFLGGTVKFIFIIQSYLNRPEIRSHPDHGITETLHGEDFYSLIIVIVAFAMIWAYSVLEAFWTAKKQESEAHTKDNSE